MAYRIKELDLDLPVLRGFMPIHEQHIERASAAVYCFFYLPAVRFRQLPGVAQITADFLQSVSQAEFDLTKALRS